MKPYSHFQYDPTDKYSIWEYSKRLLGKTLNDVVGGIDEEDNTGKGRLGQMVERYFFGYEPNSNPTPDFEEAGMELKCTPLKELANLTLQIKERLVGTMIDFSEDYKHPFKESHVYIKCACMLILMYLHEANVPAQHLKFIYSILWQIPEKDLLIMEQDYDKIVAKIRCGKAHELSEGETTYLGACRKGQKGDSDQFYTLPSGKTCDIPAPKRAFSLKTQYMKTILDFIQKYGDNAIVNTPTLVEGYGPGLISKEELKKQSFEDILLGRFRKYIGMSYTELCKALGLEKTKAKNKYALIANAILTMQGERGADVKKSEEFKKSGNRIKTIRIQKNGRPKEAMSFENINYFDILHEDDLYESRLYELFTSRFLFIVFHDCGVHAEEEYRLQKAFFWTMENEDLHEAELYWQNIKDNVAANHIAPEYFYREGDHKKFHVRPKAKNSLDLAANPHGGMCKKYCYWFNHKYIQNIVKYS
jgi:DNA mismatch repair protein MutH